MRLLSTLILGGAVALASPAVFAAGHNHGGNGHHHTGQGGSHHHHGGYHGGYGYNYGNYHHHHHHNHWPNYNYYRPNYGYGIAPFPYYGAYGIGSPYYRGGNGFSLYIGR